MSEAVLEFNQLEGWSYQINLLYILSNQLWICLHAVDIPDCYPDPAPIMESEAVILTAIQNALDIYDRHLRENYSAAKGQLESVPESQYSETLRQIIAARSRNLIADPDFIREITLVRDAAIDLANHLTHMLLDNVRHNCVTDVFEPNRERAHAYALFFSRIELPALS